MVESHHMMVTTILLAVVIVGVTGLYFTMSQPDDNVSVVYVGNMPTVSSPGIYRPVSQSFAVPESFRIRATGWHSTLNGTALINTTGNITFDIRMPKNSISCEAAIYQGNDSAVLPTCGDYDYAGDCTGGEIYCGGWITCDDNADGGSESLPTNASNCADDNNKGSFYVCNHGAWASLGKNISTVLIGGVEANGWSDGSTAILTSLYESVNNSVPALNGTCNRCVPEYWQDCTFYSGSEQGTVGQYFATSGQCVCQCFYITLDNVDDIHLLKSGDALTFAVQDYVFRDDAFNSTADCTAYS